MKHDDRKQQAAVALSIVFVLIGIGWMALLHVMKPAGLVGQSVDHRKPRHRCGLREDRRATVPRAQPDVRAAGCRQRGRGDLGQGIRDRQVPDRSDDRHPGGTRQLTGHSEFRVGVVGVRHRANSGQRSAAVGDIDRGRAVDGGSRGSDGVVAGRAGHSQGRDVCIWGGQRSQIDPTDRSVTFNLGLDPGVTYPIEISNALFDAMPSTEPLVVPVIPDLGTPSSCLPGSTVGSVAGNPDANGAVTGFYVLLPDGVQKITSFVADLLRTALAQGSATPTLISPDKLIHIPVVDVLDVGYYPRAS